MPWHIPQWDRDNGSMNFPRLSLVSALLVPILAGCGPNNLTTGSNGTAGTASSTASLGATTPDPDNPQAPILPDPKMTPGDTLDVASGDVCTPGYTKLVRNVPSEVKKEVYAAYGITHREQGEFEVDHLISLELGGSNDIKNLWPESYLTEPWNAKVKDQLENELHAEICDGRIDMKTAQREIATDWIAAYKKHFHTDQPLSERDAAHIYNKRGGSAGYRSRVTDDDQDIRSRTSNYEQNSSHDTQTDPQGGSGKVWVNTRSGAYWRPGTEYYGKTKQGEYMPENQAIQQGYHPAGER
jgi:hypothetical protein